MPRSERPAPQDKPRTYSRRREALVGVRLTTQEYAALKAAADQHGESPAAVLRRAYFQAAEANQLTIPPAFVNCFINPAVG